MPPEPTPNTDPNAQPSQQPPEGGGQQPPPEDPTRTDLSTLPDDVRGYIGSLRQEAADHRTARREAEQERDGLRERVEASDRADVERMVGDRLASVEDFWLTTQLDDLRGENGQVDPELVTAAVEKVVEERPHWAKQQRRADFGQGVRSADHGRQRASFGEGLKNALRGG